MRPDRSASTRRPRSPYLPGGRGEEAKGEVQELLGERAEAPTAHEADVDALLGSLQNALGGFSVNPLLSVATQPVPSRFRTFTVIGVGM